MNNEKLKMSGLEDWLNQLNDEKRKIEILEDLHHENFTDFYRKELGVYEFQEGLGLCGILLPTGHFLKCHDRQHSLIASLLNENEKFLSIYFSSRLIFDNDKSVFSLHIDNNSDKFNDGFTREKVICNLQLAEKANDLNGKVLITQSQVNFIKNHYHFMNTSQKEMISIKFLKKIKMSNTFSEDLIRDNHCILSI